MYSKRMKNCCTILTGSHALPNKQIIKQTKKPSKCVDIYILLPVSGIYIKHALSLYKAKPYIIVLLFSVIWIVYNTNYVTFFLQTTQDFTVKIYNLD